MSDLGITAAAVLVHAGIGAEAAFAQISEARGLRVPDTARQREWIIENQPRFRSGEGP